MAPVGACLVRTADANVPQRNARSQAGAADTDYRESE
jgi:hypothetical protein